MSSLRVPTRSYPTHIEEHMSKALAPSIVLPSALAAALVGVMALVSVAPGSAAPPPAGRTDAPEASAAASIAVDGAPAGQRAAVADGVITIEEYTAAAEATVACAATAGATISIVPAVGLAPPGLTFTAPTLEEAERTRSILAGCQARHFDAIDLLWAATHRATSEEQVAAAARWVDACARDALGAGTAPDQLLARGMCVRRHYETFGYWP